ncbi:polysaccharide lyase [Niabella pedocola]|uniref:Polysaccharide lyase n=1 Tax=Niabella pedocola TaxID=1752077 RepID=A0ABS8PNC1_9BACT|nr:heparin lyase I family protein [Niabella pedocola]MCD2422604.1 polysaccharide lyase [Niabella pedocola]
MKSFTRVSLMIAILILSVFACSTRNPFSGEISAASENTQSGSQNPGSYKISLNTAQALNDYIWIYTITKTDKAKDIGYFILNLGNPDEASPTINNIISARINGVDWTSKLKNTNGNTSCGILATNFVKFEELGAADQYIVEIKLDTIYARVNTTGWVKAGTSCSALSLQGPGRRGYQLTASMQSDSTMPGKKYNAINTYMKGFGFDYSEHPNCSGGYGGHADGIHCDTELDPFFNKYVFRFNIHIDPVIDGDRCSSGTVDRQRNEMKSATNNTTWAKVQGNWDEWQLLEWKFKLPKGFQPTTSFCHIHQLKAQDGPNNGSPLITITPRASSSGGNKRIQIIHSVDGASTGKGTIVDNIPLADFEDEWVQVKEEVHYTHNGYYACKITRVKDGKVLVDYKDENIDMWRKGSSYMRNKYGIYRSLAGGRLDRNPVGQSPLLKNESLWLTDFNIYEKNPNPNPGQVHD